MKSVATQIIVIMYGRRRTVVVRRVGAGRRSGVKGGTAGVSFQNKHIERGPRRKGTLAQQVKSLQRVVSKNSPEVKYFDIPLDTTDIPTTGSVKHISAIAQGDTDQQRTGDSILVTSIRVSGFFVKAALISLGVNAQYRVALVVDKQQVTDTAPTAQDIFEYPGEPTADMARVINLERFRFLHISPVYFADMMQLKGGAVSQTQRNSFEYNWKGSIRVSFNGANGTDMQKNNIYFVLLSNDTTGDFDGTARIGFTDV